MKNDQNIYEIKFNDFGIALVVAQNYAEAEQKFYTVRQDVPSPLLKSITILPSTNIIL